MARTELTLHLEPTRAGLAAGHRALDELERDLFGPSEGPSSDRHDAVTLVESFGDGTLAPEVVKVLPAGKEHGLTPEEIGSLIDNPYDPGSSPSKGSVRGAIRIIQRKQKKLADDGRIDGDVLRWDWTHYDRDGAGRYFIDQDARRALDAHFRNNGT
jgi:hypothetical protein